MKPKTLSQLKKDLTKVFNQYVRRRDSIEDGTMFKCICCGQVKPMSLCHASHFYASTFTAVRWDEDNVNAGCSHCNTFLHGNLLEYRKGLLAKIGEERLQRLEIRRHNEAKYDRGTLEILIKRYKSMI
jgi:hypothetical protein